MAATETSPLLEGRQESGGIQRTRMKYIIGSILALTVGLVGLATLSSGTPHAAPREKTELTSLTRAEGIRFVVLPQQLSGHSGWFLDTLAGSGAIVKEDSYELFGDEQKYPPVTAKHTIFDDSHKSWKKYKKALDEWLNVTTDGKAAGIKIMANQGAVTHAARLRKYCLDNDVNVIVYQRRNLLRMLVNQASNGNDAAEEEPERAYLNAETLMDTINKLSDTYAKLDQMYAADGFKRSVVYYEDLIPPSANNEVAWQKVIDSLKLHTDEATVTADLKAPEALTGMEDAIENFYEVKGKLEGSKYSDFLDTHPADMKLGYVAW